MFDPNELESLRPRLMAEALRLTHDAYSAEDLVQDTFLTALEHRERYANGNLAGWLATIMRHVHIDGYRVERREPEMVSLDDPDIPEETSELPAPDDTLSQEMLTALERLPDTQSEAVRMLYVELLDYDEIAELLGVAEATVRQRVSRGLRRLRAMLGEAESWAA